MLVHGGSHGAWCWDAVIDGLAERGVSARAFDLPGSGGDRTPRARLTLDETARALVAQIDATPAGDVRIVGHSIAGWLLPIAAARRPNRVSELVFLAGVTLDSGQRGIDMIPKTRRASYYEMAAASDDNSLMPSFENARRRFFGHLGEEDARAAYQRLTPQAFGPYLDRATVGIGDVDTARRYLAMTDDITFPEEFTRSFAARAAVKPEVLPGDHCIMLSAPDVLAAALSSRR